MWTHKWLRPGGRIERGGCRGSDVDLQRLIFPHGQEETNLFQRVGRGSSQYCIGCLCQRHAGDSWLFPCLPGTAHPCHFHWRPSPSRRGGSCKLLEAPDVKLDSGSQGNSKGKDDEERGW